MPPARPETRRAYSTWVYVAFGMLCLGAAVAVMAAFRHTASPASVQPSEARPSAPAGGDAARTVRLPKLVLPNNADVMVIGDSWSTGYAADPGQGYVEVLAREFGWRISNVPNAPSSGWEYRGPRGFPGTFAERLARQPRDSSIDLMLMHGGLNDQQVVRDGSDMTTSFNSQVRAAIKLVRDRYPRARIVVLGPIMPVKNYQGIIPEIDDRLSVEAARKRFFYISPYQEGWMDTDAKIDKYIDHRSSDHPNTLGHALLAKRTSAHLKRFMSKGQTLELP